MKTTFYISEHRLYELKCFIRNYLPTARFICNPYKIGNEYSICLEMDIEDGNKLNELHNKWHKEDSPPKPIIKSFWNCILDILK
jgi:hypothetical protein